MMIWYKNTIIEVKQTHIDFFLRSEQLFFKDAIAYAIMCHFEEMNNVRVWDDIIGLFFNDEDGNRIGVEVKNQLNPNIREPFKFIIEENPDDYWGTCTAKNLPCDRVSI